MSSRARRLKHPAAAVAGAVCAVAIGLSSDVSPVGGVATACAQTTPTVPTLPVPTLGPVDPYCSRVPDTDNDNVLDYQDNCNGYYNPSQRDTDADSGEPPYEPVRTGAQDRDPATGGDTCDVDDDGDRIEDVSDNCPKHANKDQADLDRDGIGDACDEETVPPGSKAPSKPVVVGSAPPSSGAGGGSNGAGAGAGGSSSASGGGTGAASGPAARPTLTVFGLPRRRRVPEMRAGLAVPVRCTAACVVAGELLATRTTAKRMRIRASRAGSVLGRGSARLGASGTTFVFVRVPAETLKRIAKARRAETRLRLTVTDAAGGNRSSVERRVEIRR